jgi:hypothetical protein
MAPSAGEDARTKNPIEENSMKIALILVGIILAILLLVRLGLSIKPKPFPAYAQRTPDLQTIPLPAGLPVPVERFYRTVYDDRVPVIKTVVLTGRATIRPMFNIPLPARFVFVHNAGVDYRHYIEATFSGLPVLKVNEGYLEMWEGGGLQIWGSRGTIEPLGHGPYPRAAGAIFRPLFAQGR